MKDYKKAIDYLEEAFRIRHDKYDDAHPETKETKDLIDNINKAIMDKINYPVTEMKTNAYTPQPVDTSKVELSEDFLQLAECMVENVHEV